MHRVRYFLAVADELNFTRAAQKCEVAQPSLTRGVQRLEAELGGILFHRERSRTHLTKLGKLMRPALQAIYDSASSAKALANAFHVGDRSPIAMALGHTVSISMLSMLLPELARVLPGSEVQLFRGEPKAIAERLKSGEMEIALAGILDDGWDRLDSWPLFTENFVAVVPTQHHLASCNSIDISGLAGTVLLPRPCAHETATINSTLQQFGLHQNTNFHTCSDGDLLALVEAGLGCAFLPESSAPPPMRRGAWNRGSSAIQNGQSIRRGGSSTLTRHGYFDENAANRGLEPTFELIDDDECRSWCCANSLETPHCFVRVHARSILRLREPAPYDAPPINDKRCRDRQEPAMIPLEPSDIIVACIVESSKLTCQRHNKTEIEAKSIVDVRQYREGYLTTVFQFTGIHASFGNDGNDPASKLVDPRNDASHYG